MGAIYDSTVNLILRAQDEATATLRQVGDVFAGLGKSIDAVMAHTPGFDKIGQQAETAARDAGDLDSALARVGEAARSVGERFDEATGLTDHFHESLSRVKETAISFTLGTLGFEALNEAQIGIESFGKGLIEANATAESLTQTMAAIYHSGAEAQQAVAWMNNFALSAPFTRESIMQASTTIAALGLDITQVIPALGNLAAVMRTDMPTAAQAFMDAYEGRFQMMQRDLHVSKQQLVEYGLQIDANGKIVSSSLAPAFERFVAANYPRAMTQQMTTFNGQMSNLTDQFQNFERIAGGEVFGKLKEQLLGFLTYLQGHQQEVNAFAATIGEGLGNAFTLLSQGVSAVVSALPTMINLWNNISDAIRPLVTLVGTDLSNAFAAYVGYVDTVIMPLIRTAIDTMAQWWADHGQAIVDDFTILGQDLAAFWQWLISNSAAWFQTLSGAWQIGWGLISNTFLGALDLFSGKWADFGNDMVRLAASMLVGIVDTFEGLVEITTNVLEGLLGPFNNFMHLVNQAWVAIADGLLVVAVTIETTFLNMINGLTSKINGFITGATEMLHKLPIVGGAIKVQHNTIPQIDVNKAAQGLLSHRKGLEDLVGLPSNENVVFQQSAAQAHAAEKARRDEIIRTIEGNFTRITGQKYDQPATGDQAAHTSGDDPFAKLLAEFKKLTEGPGLKLDLSKGKGLPPWLGGLPVPPQTGGDGAAPTSKQLKDYVTAAQQKFDYDLLNHASKGTLNADLAAVLAGMKKAGDNQWQIGVERLNDQKRIADATKKDDTTLLNALHMQFDLDKVDNASDTVLQKDIKNILDQMRKDGSTALQIAYERATLEQQVAKATGAGKAVTAPKIGTGFQKSIYGYTSREQVGQGVGLGQTLVTFGGRVGGDPAQQMIDKLQTQVDQLTQQNHALQTMIGVMEDGRDATVRVGDILDGMRRSTPGAGIGNPLRPRGLATATR